VRHLRRRRRDLLEDAVLAILLMTLAVILTPGLGVIAIIEVPVGLLLIATVLVERRRSRIRRSSARRRRPSP
jgi:hypothetical protein